MPTSTFPFPPILGNGSASNRPNTSTQVPGEVIIFPIVPTGPPADEVDPSRHILKLMADMSTVLNGLELVTERACCHRLLFVLIPI